MQNRARLNTVFAMPREDERTFSLAVVALAILMACKFLYLAFFITPLWDIPDETGHLAYVMDLAAGRGIPVIGSAQIPSQVMSHMYQTPSAKPIGNWIAQHPPLFYSIAAIPYWIAQFFTSNVEILYRVPRVIAAVCGALLLLVLYRTARLLGHSDRAALCFSGCVLSIPMVSHMSSGTNHDMMLFLLGALTVHFLVRFTLNREMRDLYYAAIWLSLAGFTKMTAWIILPPFMMVVAWELPGPTRHWATHFLLITAVAVSLPAAWVLRNVYQYGNPIYTSLDNGSWQLAKPLNSSIFEFLNTQPVIEHFILNYYGLIGWIGTGVGELKWFQVDGIPRHVFALLLLAISVSLLWQFYEGVRWPLFRPSARLADRVLSSRIRGTGIWPYIQILIFIIVAVVFAALIHISMKVGIGMTLRLTSVAMIFALGVGAPVAILVGGRSDRRLFMYGLACFMFFAVVVVSQIYHVYVLSGQMRATHGRYFYIVIPWLLMSLGVALAFRPWSERLLLAAFPLLVLAETDAYINQVLPFVRGVTW